MIESISSRSGKYRHILLAVSFLMLVALSLALVLSGCGGKEAAVETEEEVEETAPEGEVEGEDENTSDSLDEENGEYVELDWEYTDDLHGFSVSFPEDWECEENEFGDGCYITSDLCTVSVFGEFNLEGATPTPEERLERHVTLIESYRGVSIERDPSTLIIGTFDGADYVYDFWVSSVSSSRPFIFNESSNGHLYDDVMYVRKGEEIFGFLATYPVDQVEEIGPIVEAMIDSFTLPE